MQRIAPTSFLAGLCTIAAVPGAVAHDLAPIGAEFVATSRVANDQHDAWVTCDDNGDFVIAYSQGDVYFRLLDRDGNPLADDVRVNPTLSGGTQIDSHVSRDPVTGDFMVAMSDHSGFDGSGHSTVGRFYQADGTPLGAEKILNVHTNDSQFEPVSAFAPDGTVFVVWSDADPLQDGSSGVYGRLFTRTGAPITGEFLVNDASDKVQINPSIAASREGHFVCAYTDASGATGPQRQILYRLFDADGVKVGAERLANSATDGGDQKLPSTAMDADGDFVIVWRDEGANDGAGFGVFARLFDANGDPKGPQFVVSQTTSGNQSNPNVAMDYVGNFVVGWESDAAGTNDAFARWFDRNGNPLSDELRLHDDAADEQVDVQVALSQSGERLIAIWHHGPVNDGDIHARIFDAPTVQFTGTAALEQTVDIDVRVPGMGGNLYFILPSLLSGPTISVNGDRTLDLGVDSLMVGAVANPESNLFSQIAGTLDPSGAATASVSVPDNAAFYGLHIRFALLTLDAGHVGSYGLGTDTLDGIRYLSDVRTLMVDGPVRFHPGQGLEGALEAKTFPTPPDEDRATFEAFKKQKVKIKVQKITDLPVEQVASQLRIEVRDVDGLLLKGLNAKPGKKKKSKLKFKSKQDGTYFLYVTSHDELLGAYEFKTSAKSKKNSKPSTKVLKIGKNGTAKKKVAAVAGTTLSIEAKALKGAPPLATVTIRDPAGDAISVQAFLTTDGVTLFATDIPLDTTGTYEVELSGTKGDKYRLALTPTPPDASGVVELQ